MTLLEFSMLLGYVVAMDDDNKTLLYFYAGCDYSNELISVLQQSFEGWSIILTNNIDKAKTLCNSADISYQIDCVSSENINKLMR